MRGLGLILILCAGVAQANQSVLVEETVYVEAQTDTDQDGKLDRIYTKVSRPSNAKNLPVIFSITPYALGGNNVKFHSVNKSRLPQDTSQLGGDTEVTEIHRYLRNKELAEQSEFEKDALARGYATVSSDSVGTGRSTGCPTVGDEAETLGAKAVIDWLNGRARAFDSKGREVFATWSNGNVGMTGVSYNGTLPNMVATTGVEGLKAIIPVAAISNWYDYYRANGLVVGPGGYEGEDADVLGKYIVRRNACRNEMNQLTADMGREHGDYTPFWQVRDYVRRADGVKAAVFIVHGQSDWNVKQRHATQWWQALDGQVPLKMWLHRGGHGGSDRSDYSTAKWAWFDRYVKGVENGVEDDPRVEVESSDYSWMQQDDWPHEDSEIRTFFLDTNQSMALQPGKRTTALLRDNGRTKKLENLLGQPDSRVNGRLAFLSERLDSKTLLSGSAKVNLTLSLLNRSAANITVAIVEYASNGNAKLITRGWADPQNHQSLSEGVPLEKGEEVSLGFVLEPKQYKLRSGSRIGIVVASTDYDYTIRPDAGTEISLVLGEESWVELQLQDLD